MVLTFLFVPASLESVSLSSPAPALALLAAAAAAAPEALDAVVFLPFFEGALPAVAEVGVGAPDAPPPSLSLSLKDVDRGVGARDPGVECVVDAGVCASYDCINHISPSLDGIRNGKRET